MTIRESSSSRHPGFRAAVPDIVAPLDPHSEIRGGAAITAVETVTAFAPLYPGVDMTSETREMKFAPGV